MEPLNLEVLIPDSEHECADQLAELRWGIDGPSCRRCDGRRFGRLKKRPRVFVCRGCKADNSVTAGTLMHGCHVPLRHWFLASILLSRTGGCTAKELQRRTEVTYETAWELLHRIRSAVADSHPNLVGQLAALSTGVATTRPYRCGSHGRNRNPSTIAGIMGVSGVVLQQIPWAMDVVEWAERLQNKPIAEATRGSVLWFALRKLAWQIGRIHCGVSERWLRNYASEIQHRENDVVCGFLKASMHGIRTRFVDLRPPFEPEWNSGFS